MFPPILSILIVLVSRQRLGFGFPCQFPWVFYTDTPLPGTVLDSGRIFRRRSRVTGRLTVGPVSVRLELKWGWEMGGQQRRVTGSVPVSLWCPVLSGDDVRCLPVGGTHVRPTSFHFHLDPQFTFSKSDHCRKLYMTRMLITLTRSPTYTLFNSLLTTFFFSFHFLLLFCVE